MTNSPKIETIVCHVGPRIVTAAPDVVNRDAHAYVSAPRANNVPARKAHTVEEYPDVIRDHFDREAIDASRFVRALAEQAKSTGATLTVIVSKRAIAHAPKDGVYSQIQSVEDMMDGLTAITDALPNASLVYVK